jgi:acetoacetyl-CoA synthetase
MKNTEPGALLRPAPARDTWSSSQMGGFLEKIEAKTGRHFADYEDAWAWSVENLEDFWGEVWDHFEIISHAPYTSVLAERTMPGAQWFTGARINFTEHILRSLARRPDDTMVKSRSQTNGSIDWTGARLTEEIERIQQGLIRNGIKPGWQATCPTSRKPWPPTSPSSAWAPSGAACLRKWVSRASWGASANWNRTC